MECAGLGTQMHPRVNSRAKEREGEERGGDESRREEGRGRKLR